MIYDSRLISFLKLFLFLWNPEILSRNSAIQIQTSSIRQQPQILHLFGEINYKLHLIHEVTLNAFHSQNIEWANVDLNSTKAKPYNVDIYSIKSMLVLLYPFRQATLSLSLSLSLSHWITFLIVSNLYPIMQW